MVKSEIFVFCDGGARGNPGPGAAACVIKDSAGKARFLCGKYLGKVTNNQAEYAAVELALATIRENYRAVKKARFFLDSRLVVNQLNGLYKVKDPSLREVLFEVRQLESCLEEVYYQHIAREENTEADTLVNRVINQGYGFQHQLT